MFQWISKYVEIYLMNYESPKVAKGKHEVIVSMLKMDLSSNSRSLGETVRMPDEPK